MFDRQKLIVSFALLLPALPLAGGPLVYVVNGPPSGAAQFGTIDLATGAFTTIGGPVPGQQGLIPGPNGTLLSLAFSGDLDSIDPLTGTTTVIGPTGLVDCSAPPASPCGPNSANALASTGGQVYATDFSNNLYHVNPETGAASLIGATGIPAVPFTPTTFNQDGSLNLYVEGLFGANGGLYTTFAAGTLDLATLTISEVIAPNLYRINPVTGAATLIGPTEFGLDAVVEVNGTVYAFDDSKDRIVQLDLATGHTSAAVNFDAAAGVVTGAATVPEPASGLLMAMAISALGIVRWRARPRS